MKRERVNDEEDTDDLAYRNTSSGIKFRVINVKQERLLSKNITMPTNLAMGGDDNDDSQSGEDIALSLADQNATQSFINIDNSSAPIYFMLPNETHVPIANQSAIVTRLGQPEVCLLNPEEEETHGTTRRPVRDDKRRATHNEIERRRRGKINNSIEQLAEVLPGILKQVGSRQGDSKGVVLSKACEFIGGLKEKNDSLRRTMTEMVIMKENIEELSSQIEKAREENRLLRERVDGRIHFITPE